VVILTEKDKLKKAEVLLGAETFFWFLLFYA
jgi:hypothetical protein